MLNILSRKAQRYQPELDKSAQVLLMSDRIVLHPWAYPGPFDGAFFTAPVIRLGLHPSDEELAGAVRECLLSSEHDISIPTRNSDYVRPLYDAAGVQDWPQLQQSSQSLGINLNSTGFDIIPSHNGGIEGEDAGFSPLLELAVKLSLDVTDAVLAQSVRRGFSACY